MRRAGSLIAVLVAGAVFAGSAVAQSDPSPDPGVPQISQYVEVIPTAQGGLPTSARKKGRQAQDAANLSSQAREKVENEGGSDAQVLTEIASSSTPVVQPKQRPKAKPKAEETPANVRPRDAGVDSLALPHGVRITAASNGRARLVAICAIVVLLTGTLVVASRARLRNQAAP